MDSQSTRRKSCGPLYLGGMASDNEAVLAWLTSWGAPPNWGGNLAPG